MTATLTPEELEAIRKRAEEARGLPYPAEINVDAETLCALLSALKAAEERAEKAEARISELSVEYAEYCCDATSYAAALESDLTALRAQVEAMREVLGQIMDQAESDLSSAHHEICKLQGLDPEKHDWPEWSSPANTVRWFAEIRERFGLNNAALKEKEHPHEAG